IMDTSTGTKLGTAPLRLMNGTAQAVLSISSLAPGLHTITATYRGDGTFAFSPDNPIQLAVVQNTGLLLLDPSGRGALHAGGRASVVLTNNGVIDVASSNAAGILATGSAHLQAAEFDLHGSPGYLATGGARLQGTVASGVSLSQLSMQVPADLAALPV